MKTGLTLTVGCPEGRCVSGRGDSSVCSQAVRKHQAVHACTFSSTNSTLGALSGLTQERREPSSLMNIIKRPAAAWEEYLQRHLRPSAAAAAASAAACPSLAPSAAPPPAAAPAAAAAAAATHSAPSPAAAAAAAAHPAPSAPPAAPTAAAAHSTPSDPSAAAPLGPSASPPARWWCERWGGAHGVDGRDLAVPLGRRHSPASAPIPQGDQTRWIPEPDAFEMLSASAMSALVSTYARKINPSSSPGFVAALFSRML
eukprot:1144415-Pelagomonas_calceolata.AAC.3